jgi:putative FmdB family regulatory protein
VATYEYRCGDCGRFEQRMPMGTATAVAACPSCGRDAKRIFAVPMTYRTSKPLARMLAREEASRDYPTVSTGCPRADDHDIPLRRIPPSRASPDPSAPPSRRVERPVAGPRARSASR